MFHEYRVRDVNYWLDNMESRLEQLDLSPEESETVEIQIQQLRVSVKVPFDNKTLPRFVFISVIFTITI